MIARISPAIPAAIGAPISASRAASASVVLAAIAVLALVSLISGCTRASEPRPIERERPRAKLPPQPSPAEVAAATRAVVHGPAPASAAVSDAERRAAVLELLTDGSTAVHLPLDTADPGVRFDRGAADRLPSAPLP